MRDTELPPAFPVFPSIPLDIPASSLLQAEQHGFLVRISCAVGGVDQSGKPTSSKAWMSSRVDSAIPTRLSSIRNELIGKKLRVVGKYVP